MFFTFKIEKGNLLVTHILYDLYDILYDFVWLLNFNLSLLIITFWKFILGGPKVGIQCVVRFIQFRNLFRWLIVHLSHMYFGRYKNHSHPLMFNISDT